MSGGRQGDDDQRVEFVVPDPEVFSPSPVSRQPAASSLQTRLIAIAVGVAAVVAVGLAAWPDSPHGAAHATSTTPPPTSTTTASSDTSAPGPVAPQPTVGVAFTLSATPGIAPFGTEVRLQLKGDLRDAMQFVAATAWIDQQVAGTWRSVWWSAKFANGTRSGSVNAASLVGGANPTAGAVLLPVRISILVNADHLDSGSYRVCRDVPMRTSTSSDNKSGPRHAYVCAPLVVNHIFGY
jgi:hypothetical protein